MTPTPNTPGRYVFVFGKNDKGQLGLSTKLKPSRPSSLPIEAFGLGAQVKVISSGTNHTLACTESGELYATGSNKEGTLGLGESEKEKTVDSFVRITTGPASMGPVAFVAAGERTSAAVTTNGQLFTWGSNTPFYNPLSTSGGGLGYSSKMEWTPRQVVFEGEAPVSVKEISFGSLHAICLTTTGEAYSWGVGSWGRLGRGDAVSHETPGKVLFEQKIARVASTRSTSGLVSADDGQVYMWGKNDTFLLGTDSAGSLMGGGGFDGANVPTRMNLPKEERFIDLAIGENLAAAVTENGEVWTWGKNIQVPRKIKGIDGVVQVSVGRGHMAFVTKDGKLYTMGDNSNNQLGTSSGAFNTSDPHLINGEFLPGSAKHVACGYYQTLVVCDIE